MEEATKRARLAAEGEPDDLQRPGQQNSSRPTGLLELSGEVHCLISQHLAPLDRKNFIRACKQLLHSPTLIEAHVFSREIDLKSNLAPTSQLVAFHAGAKLRQLTVQGHAYPNRRALPNFLQDAMKDQRAASLMAGLSSLKLETALGEHACEVCCAVPLLSPGLQELAFGECTAPIHIPALAHGLRSLQALDLVMVIQQPHLSRTLSDLSLLTGLTRLGFSAFIRGMEDDPEPPTLNISSLTALKQLRQLGFSVAQAKLQGLFPGVATACTQLESLNLAARGLAGLDPALASSTQEAEAQLLSLHEGFEEELLEEEASRPGAQPDQQLPFLQQLEQQLLLHSGQAASDMFLRTIWWAGLSAEALAGTGPQRAQMQESWRLYRAGQAARGRVRSGAAAKVRAAQGTGTATGEVMPASWPSLRKATVSGLEPGEVQVMQLHRALKLESISVPSLYLQHGSPLSAEAVLRDLCRALVYSSRLNAADTKLVLSLDGYDDTGVSGLMHALSKMAGHVRDLSLISKPELVSTAIKPGDVSMLAYALPHLTHLKISCDELPGQSLVEAVEQLLDLESLYLISPPAGSGDLTAACLLAQKQVQMGVRKRPLTVRLGNDWDSGHADRVKEAVRELLSTDLFGPCQVHVLGHGDWFAPRVEGVAGEAVAEEEEGEEDEDEVAEDGGEAEGGM